MRCTRCRYAVIPDDPDVVMCEPCLRETHAPTAHKTKDMKWWSYDIDGDWITINPRITQSNSNWSDIMRIVYAQS